MSFRLRFYLFIFTVVATLCSCSSISKRQSYSYPLPPKTFVDVQDDQALENIHLADPTNAPLKALIRYRQAKLWMRKDSVKSCALWQNVLREPQFPLAHVARLRAMEACDERSKQTKAIDDAIDETGEPWLSELLLRSTLARAKRTDNKAWEMRLSFRAVEFEKLQSEKLKLLSRARILAIELGNETEARNAQSKIEVIAPRFKAKPVPDEYLAVASDFKQAREFEKSREIFSRLVGETTTETIGPLEKLKALDGIRMSFKLEKRTDDYLAASREYSDFAASELLQKGLKEIRSPRTAENGRQFLKRYLETRITLARAVWTEDSPRKAALILRAAEADVKSLIPTHDSVLIRARIEEEAGHFTETVRLLQAIKPTKISNRETRLKVLWSLAWNQKKIGKLKEAAEGLTQLIAQEDSASAASRDRFWLAKLQVEMGLPQKAKEQFENLIVVDPQSWYALLAYRELGLQIPPLPDDSSIRQPTSDERDESAFSLEEKLTFEWLIAAGENDLAKKFLKQIARDRKAGYTESQMQDLLLAFTKAGDYQSLFATLSELPVAQKQHLTKRMPELIYPQPFALLVDGAAKKFNVPSELIYSIMRQESSFDPLARSPADAFGLMQLIPEMAKRAEGHAGLKIGSHEDLYTPEVNIPLGAAFVRDLLDRWQGAFIPTVASYNASDKAIAGWLRTRYHGDVLVFIEDIPYEETRNYIKLVMRNYISYRRLNSGGAKIAFPEWCLAGLHPANL